MKDYRNQVELGQVDSQLVHASYLPQVANNIVFMRRPTMALGGYDQVLSSSGNFTTVVAVTKTLVGQKHLDAEYGTIRLNNQGIADNEDLGWDLKRNITTQYITTYGDLQQLNFNRDIFQLLDKESNLLTRADRKKCVSPDRLPCLPRHRETGSSFTSPARYRVP